MNKLLSKIILILLSIFLLPAFGCNQVNSDVLFDPINSEDAPVKLTEISKNEDGKYVFHFETELSKLCNKQNICSEGTYNNFISTTSLVVFKGDKQPRYKKSAIMWEVKFLEHAPTLITYGETPFNGRQIIKPKKLIPGEPYSICIYPKNGIITCSRWNYK